MKHLKCLLRKLAWLGSPLLAIALLFAVGGLARAFAAEPCATWTITESPDEPESVGYAGSYGGDFCAGYGAALSTAGATLDACTVEDDVATVIATTSTIVTVHYTWQGSSCAGETGGVEFEPVVANPAPASIVIAMAATFLVLIWWVIFK